MVSPWILLMVFLYFFCNTECPILHTKFRREPTLPRRKFVLQTRPTNWIMSARCGIVEGGAILLHPSIEMSSPQTEISHEHTPCLLSSELKRCPRGFSHVSSTFKHATANRCIPKMQNVKVLAEHRGPGNVKTRYETGYETDIEAIQIFSI